MGNTRLLPFLLVSALLGCRSSAPPASSLDEGRTAAERAFDWTLGEWHGVRRSASDGQEEPLTMRVDPVLAGVGQLRQLEVRHSGGIYRGLALQIYDANAQCWVRQYANDVRRTYWRLEGEVEGERAVFRSATPGRTSDSRVISERIGPDRWRRTVSRSTDGGATWSEVFTDELRR